MSLDDLDDLFASTVGDTGAVAAADDDDQDDNEDDIKALMQSVNATLAVGGVSEQQDELDFGADAGAQDAPAWINDIHSALDNAKTDKSLFDAESGNLFQDDDDGGAAVAAAARASAQLAAMEKQSANPPKKLDLGAAVEDVDVALKKAKATEAAAAKVRGGRLEEDDTFAADDVDLVKTKAAGESDEDSEDDNYVSGTIAFQGAKPKKKKKKKKKLTDAAKDFDANALFEQKPLPEPSKEKYVPPTYNGPEKFFQTLVDEGDEDEEEETYEERLTAFYADVAPGKLGTVEATIQRFAGKETKLFQMLAKKYPKHADHPALSDQPKKKVYDPTDARMRLTAVFRLAAPQRLDTVEQLLQTFQGKQDKLWSMLAAKYPEASARAAPPPEPKEEEAEMIEVQVSAKERLTQFYKVNAPNKLGTVDKTLKAFSGKEEKLFVMLAKKYPGAAVPPATRMERAPTPSAEPEEPQWREKLVAFFTERAPEKLDTVDWTLGKFEGKEEKLFVMLEKKYPSKEELARKAAEAQRVKDEEAARIRAAAEEEERLKAMSESKRAQKLADQSFRRRLIKFFQQHDTSQLSTVEDTIAKYRGQEEQVMFNLEKKYENGAPKAKTKASTKRIPAAFDPNAGNDDMFFGAYQPKQVKRSVQVEQERLRHLAAERAAGKKSPTATKRKNSSRPKPAASLFAQEDAEKDQDVLDALFN